MQQEEAIQRNMESRHSTDSRNRYAMNSLIEGQSLSNSGRGILNPEEWEQTRLALRMSTRELQIAQHVFDDVKSEGIAEELGISVHTINTYVQRLYSKLEVRSRPQLVLRILGKHLEGIGRFEQAKDSAYQSGDPSPCMSSTDT
jgi:DNA-binding NarL/FixJ family response regulator